MKIQLQEKKKKEITVLPASTYQAVVYGVWDLGLQRNIYEGEESIKHQMMIGIEVNETITDEGDYQGKRYCLHPQINIPNFFSDRSNLVKIVSAITGKMLTAEDFKEFDADQIIGKNFTVNTGITSGGNAKAIGYGALMKGMPEIEPENKADVPKWVQSIIDNQVVENKDSEDSLPF